MLKSDKTGWDHLYLYTANGKLQNAITSGPFSVKDILLSDFANGIIYFTTNAESASSSGTSNPASGIYAYNIGCWLDLQPTRHACCQAEVDTAEEECDHGCTSYEGNLHDQNTIIESVADY